MQQEKEINEALIVKIAMSQKKRKVQLITNLQLLCTIFWPCQFMLFSSLPLCVAYFYFFFFFSSFLFHSWSTQVPLSAGSLLKVFKPHTWMLTELDIARVARAFHLSQLSSPSRTQSLFQNSMHFFLVICAHISSVLQCLGLCAFNDLILFPNQNSSGSWCKHNR